MLYDGCLRFSYFSVKILICYTFIVFSIYGRQKGFHTLLTPVYKFKEITDLNQWLFL